MLFCLFLVSPVLLVLINKKKALNPHHHSFGLHSAKLLQKQLGKRAPLQRAAGRDSSTDSLPLTGSVTCTKWPWGWERPSIHIDSWFSRLQSASCYSMIKLVELHEISWATFSNSCSKTCNVNVSAQICLCSCLCDPNLFSPILYGGSALNHEQSAPQKILTFSLCATFFVWYHLSSVSVALRDRF